MNLVLAAICLYFGYKVIKFVINTTIRSRAAIKLGNDVKYNREKILESLKMFYFYCLQSDNVRVNALANEQHFYVATNTIMNENYSRFLADFCEIFSGLISPYEDEDAVEAIEGVAFLYATARCVQFNFIKAYMQGGNTNNDNSFVARYDNKTYIKYIEDNYEPLSLYLKMKLRRRSEYKRLVKIMGYLLLG